MRWLGQALLTLLADDKGSEGDRFYYCEGGITKGHLLTLDHVSIPSLALAMWHYVLINRKENLLGRPTFEAWNRSQGEKGDKWTFVSDIGKSYPRNVDFCFSMARMDSGSATEDKEGKGEDVEPEILEEIQEQNDVKELHQTIMINNGSGPQVKDLHGDIVINIH